MKYNLVFIFYLYFIAVSILSLRFYTLVLLTKFFKKVTRVHVKSAVKSTPRIAFPKERGNFPAYLNKTEENNWAGG